MSYLAIGAEPVSGNVSEARQACSQATAQSKAQTSEAQQQAQVARARGVCGARRRILATAVLRWRRENAKNRGSKTEKEKSAFSGEANDEEKLHAERL